MAHQRHSKPVLKADFLFSRSSPLRGPARLREQWHNEGTPLIALRVVGPSGPAARFLRRPREYSIAVRKWEALSLSLIHISEPTRLGMISYAVFCLKKK